MLARKTRAQKGSASQVTQPEVAPPAKKTRAQKQKGGAGDANVVVEGDDVGAKKPRKAKNRP